jgi:hypothetical protein
MTGNTRDAASQGADDGPVAALAGTRRRLTQRRVIDHMRRGASCCRCR